ncbi:MAG: ComEC family competence protein [Candidatus Magasanikbacteria bacterium]|nr:ComEC family competence protein [Candidatus Magasanikbacteria bacterium]
MSLLDIDVIKRAALQWTIARHDFAKSKSKTFLAFCFCFIAGAGSFSFLESANLLFYLYIFVFVILFFTIIFWYKKSHRFLWLCLLFFILGAVRFLITIPEKNNSRVEFYNGEKKIVQGFIIKEPDRGVSDVRYIVRVEKLKEGRNFIPVTGNIAIKTLIYPEYNYGDNLEVECLLQEPANFEDSRFNYQKYLAKQDVRSICSNPKIKILKGSSGNWFIKTMLGFKKKIQINISRLWPEPDGSLMAGILYGSRSGLPADIADNFSRTGISHIIAVSGYNVSIIIVALNAILIYVGFFRRQSFWLLAFLILAFVFFTGASASVVRAGVMALVVLVAGRVGRLSAIGRVLVYACVIMLIFNPYILLWDAGFQLSFLATIGLVYISPIIQNFIDGKFILKNSAVLIVLEVFSTTMAAIIATLPLIMYQFGRVSLVAPLVNILILWVIPWLMLFGFLALISSFIIFPIGQLIAWLTEVGIRYVIMVVNWFGNKSWSAFDMRISLPVMIIIYLILFIFVWLKKPKFYLQK